MINPNNLSNSQQDKSPPEERVRWFVILIGIFLIAVNAYWTLMASEVWHSTQLTIATLFFNAVFTLLILVLINIILKRFLPKFALSQADLLMIYVMIVMLSTISGHPMMGYLLPVIEHPFWFASAENEWEQLFGNYLPTWLVVRDTDVLQGYFQGESSLYTIKKIKAWIWPVLIWSGFIIVLWTVLMLISLLLRKQWMENEKLSYPIVQLPLAMTGEPAKFFKNKLMWIGFGIVAAIDIWNGIAFLYPSIPLFEMKTRSIGQFNSKPWNAMGPINISFYPFIIGMMFFTPIDLSFSCWFFYLIRRLQPVFVSAVGLRSAYIFEQSIGAWMALGIIPLWMGRRHFWGILRRISGTKNDIDESSEPIKYRTGVLGIITGLIILALFCNKLGMAWWIIPLYALIYFPMVLGIARARAEVGPPEHTLIYVDPGRTLVTVFGTRRLGTPSLVAFTLLYPFNRCYRVNPLPSQLEGFRIAERAKIDSRKIMVGMLIAIVASAFITFWVYLHFLYQMGASGKARGWVVYMGWETYNRLQSWMTEPRFSNYGEMSGIAGGFLFTLFLMFMRIRFIWWPLHPAGYVLTSGEGLSRPWFAVFISWAVKSIIIRFGGAKSLRRSAPFFLGLILGDYTLGCLWSIYGIIFEMTTYRVWH